MKWHRLLPLVPLLGPIVMSAWRTLAPSTFHVTVTVVGALWAVLNGSVLDPGVGTPPAGPPPAGKP